MQKFLNYGKQETPIFEMGINTILRLAKVYYFLIKYPLVYGIIGAFSSLLYILYLE